MARLEIALLGAFQVSREGELVTQFETAPAQALLIYLVMHPEMPFRREVLADLLWPDQPRSEALHALRQTLTRLRRAIRAVSPLLPFYKLPVRRSNSTPTATIGSTPMPSRTWPTPYTRIPTAAWGPVVPACSG
jgi:hypothetical protein